MNPQQPAFMNSRRQFFTSAASGLGSLALASMLKDDGLLASTSTADAMAKNPLAPKQAHLPSKAKACIFFFMAGGPSQVDLYDPKPLLNELNGEKLPESFTKDVQFAFIQKDTATAMASPRKFTPHGESGVEYSDLVPNIGSCADDICMIRSLHTDVFNHHPAQLMMETGVPFFGRPSIGSWLLYGLGSESQNLPGYVVLSSGRGTSGGTTLWSSGFLPSTYAGVLFRNRGEPVLNLTNPPGASSQIQRASLDALRDLNAHRYEQVADQEIASRIASYELAFRMQSAAPELIDLSSETKETLEAYGVGRTRGDLKGDGRGGGSDVFDSFSRNCLLARRLVERGVRFVPIFHASWDHHSRLNEGLAHNCGMCDQPIAALLKDLKQRGLLESTLVVFAGEFGRTPLGENRKGYKTVTGRDHHPFAFSSWMAGGGVKGGQVIGKTDDFGWNIAEDPVHINDFHATLLRLFGFDHKQLTFRFAGLNVRLTNVAGNVVERVLA